MTKRFKTKTLAAAAVAAMLSFTPTHAKADPATLLATAVKFIAENIVMVLYSKTLMTYALLAANIYGGIRQRRKAKRAAAEAKAKYNASLMDRTAVVLSSLPPWQIVYGTQEVPGSIHALFTSDNTYVDSAGNTKTKHDALHHMIYVWAAHECSAAVDFILGGETCGPFDANGYSLNSRFKLSESVNKLTEVTIPVGGSHSSPVPVQILSAYFDGGGDNGAVSTTSYTLNGDATLITNNDTVPITVTITTQQSPRSSLRIRTFLGSPTQAADPVLMGLFPDKWTSDHRLRGRCYSVITVDVEDQQFQGGPPAIMARLTGKSVYDPRTSTTVPSTNPALCIRDWLLSAWGAQAVAADVDDVFISAAANACDTATNIKVDGYSDVANYSFNVSTEGFTGTHCSVAAGSGVLTVTATGDDPQITKTGISISGATARYVRIRIRRLTGTGWQGTVYYSTAGHGMTEDYRKDVSGGLVPGSFSWSEFVFDMHSLTAGAGDWQNSTITGIRIDIGTSKGDAFEIDWVALSQYQEQTVSGPKYTLNAFITTDQNRESVLTDMANAMAGTVSNSGKWLVNTGYWTAPVKTFGDNDLDGQIEFPQTDASIEDLINTVQGAYYKDGQSNPVAFEAYQNAALVTADGEELVGALDLPYTDNETRARNLARIEVERSRSGQTIRIPLMLHAWPVTVGERITVNSTEYGLVNKTYRVTDWVFSEAAPVTLVGQEDVASIYDEADTTLSDPTPNTSLQSPAIVHAVLNLAAVSGNAELIKASDGTIISRVKVSWSVVPNPYMVDSTAYTDVVWRRPLLDAADSWRSERVPALQGSTYLLGLRDGDKLTIGVRCVNSAGVEGPWEYISHTVVGKTAAPSNVTGLAYVIKPGQVQILFDECSDADFSHVVLRTGASFASGSPLTGSVETVATGTSFNWPRPANGTYTVWAVNVDTSGNMSTPQSLSVTVTDIINSEVSELTLIPRNGIVVSGSSIWRPSGGGAWDADCYSNDGHTGGAFASARFALPGEVMFGLNSDPSAALDYQNIDYALYSVGDGRVIVYQGGTYIVQVATDCTAFDVWAVVYDGTKVTYTRNGYVVYTTYPAAALGPLQFDSAFNATDSRLNSVRFGPLTNNTWNSIGGRPADAQILKNLINPATWVPGSTGSQTGFPQNPTSSGGENYIAYDSLPDGSVGVMWRARSGTDTVGNPEGGWNTEAFKIDSTRMYRFRYWIRVFGGNSSGSFYLGPGPVYDIGGGLNTNPYFHALSRNLLPDSEWCLVVGYVFPSGYSGSQLNKSGVWRSTNGVKILQGDDFRWQPGQTETIQRAYQYYTTAAGNYQDFFDPRVELCDGSETPIDQLLARSAALTASAAASAAAAAMAAAEDAQSTADGKINTYWQDAAPTGPSLGEGDIWFDTNDGYKQYRYTSGSWVLASDTRIGQAISDAATAQATADGKIVTFVSATAPTAEAVGDLWIDTANGNAIKRWDGDSWDLYQVGTKALAAAAATDIVTTNLTTDTKTYTGSTPESHAVLETSYTNSTSAAVTVEVSVYATRRLTAAAGTTNLGVATFITYSINGGSSVGSPGLFAIDGVTNGNPKNWADSMVASFTVDAGDTITVRLSSTTIGIYSSGSTLETSAGHLRLTAIKR